MSTIAVSLLPILIILVMAGMASGVIKATIQKANFLNGNVIMWLLAGYGSILFISVVFTYTIPFETSQMTSKEAQQITEKFYQAVNNGNFAEIEGVKSIDEWSFSYEHKELNIEALLTDYYYSSPWVVVEEDSSLNNEIKITRYITPHIIEKLDYTNRIPAPTIGLQQNTLTIKLPLETQVRIAKFHKEFTITQFTQEKMIPNHDSGWSANMLFLQVPEGVKVRAYEDVNLQFRRR
ncbi:hypothetical protein H1D32_05365 [Anaerobacillus sp. CMMVII]|uniref:hypothetical protein n=1 Tax=Anaerobacillus sp. CMMVII TaxID=2755588 RepID=UPI0021B6EE79|nr:hypothetical protein [Anaerobacillus sp. CMMVII]MCT8137219.1 hypothetical protein [Anaerobacillus sp. CMMVII]